MRKNQPSIALDPVFKWVIYSFISLVILYFGRSLFIPLSLALLVSMILYPFCHWMERRRIPPWMAIFLSLASFSLLISAVFALLLQQFVLFLKEWPPLREKILLTMERWQAQVDKFYFEGSLDETSIAGTGIQYFIDNVLPALPEALYRSSISLVLFVLIPVYVALMLYYRKKLVNFLLSLIPRKNVQNVRDLLPRVIITYYNFIKGMAIVYLVVGICNSIGLAIVGIPNPIFFGFVASLLTFIPYVGITIGALLPMAISWIKFDSVWYPLGTVAVFATVQVMEANIIYPLVVSNRLKINALITIVVIVAGGILWGAAGMVLFVPFVAILKLLSDQLEELQPLSALLG